LEEAKRVVEFDRKLIVIAVLIIVLPIIAAFCATPGSPPTWTMSALGQKRTLGHVRAMSALPPKADIGTQPR